MIYFKVATIPFHLAAQVLKLLPKPAPLITGACAAVVFVQPINQQVESAWHYGFEKSVSTPSVGIGRLRAPEVTVKIFHIPAGKQVVESTKQIVESVVNTTIESIGLDVNFTLGNPDEVETAIIHGALNFGITDVGQISYILATAKLESDRFKTLHEYGTGGYCGEAHKYDGWGGVGLVQLTWKGNFERQKRKLGFDHLSTEEFCKTVAIKPDVAITILIGGMMDGDFTGVGLPRYVNENKRDYVNARRVVNGVDRAHHIAAIARNYESMVERVLKDYGIQ